MKNERGDIELVKTEHGFKAPSRLQKKPQPLEGSWSRAEPPQAPNPLYIGKPRSTHILKATSCTPKHSYAYERRTRTIQDVRTSTIQHPHHQSTPNPPAPEDVRTPNLRKTLQNSQWPVHPPIKRTWIGTITSVTIVWDAPRARVQQPHYSRTLKSEVRTKNL